MSDPLRRVRLHERGALSWDDALDEAVLLLRGAEGRIVTALSGSETVEQVWASSVFRRWLGVGGSSSRITRSTSRCALTAEPSTLKVSSDARPAAPAHDQQPPRPAPRPARPARRTRRGLGDKTTMPTTADGGAADSRPDPERLGERFEVDPEAATTANGVLVHTRLVKSNGEKVELD